CLFFFSSRRRHTRSKRDWSSDVCSSDLYSVKIDERGRRLRSATTFISIGMISGIILALFLKIIELTTGNIVYHLLFDDSYIPILNTWKPVWLIEVLFHFGTCLVSITMLD